MISVLQEYTKIARDLVKQRLGTFNLSFDTMHCGQSSWVIPDEDLRERTCNRVVQTNSLFAVVKVQNKIHSTCVFLFVCLFR